MTRPSANEPPAQRTSTIWVLGGSKLGDNSQLLKAVEAMGMPFTYKTVVLKPDALTQRLPIRPSLTHVDLAASSPLTAPWPDLVVTIGRHLSCVALWVKKQSDGRTRIALFNAPRARHAAFDLVLVPAHYVLADSDRVLRYRFPLTSQRPRLLAPRETTDGDAWHVLLIGGPTKELVLDTPTALAIVQKMRQAHASTGRISIVTSRRTPQAIADALEQALRPGDTLYRWKPNDPANPYKALLAEGDSFTVTGDSPSMLIDIASLGRPLVIAPLPPSRSLALRMEQQLDDISRRLSARLPNWPLPAAPKRRYDILHDLLIEEGFAVMLGESPKAPTRPFPDESRLVAEGLKTLLD